MEIVDFLRDYWQFISIGLVIILDVIFFILRKIKVNIKLPSSTVSKLLDLINDAESVYGSGHGREKLNYVVEKYCKENDIKYFYSEVKYFLSGLVEKILDTPQKKKGD